MRLGAAALVFCLVLVGCGTGSASTTKANFIAEANAICKSLDKEIEVLQNELFALPEVKESQNALRADNEHTVQIGHKAVESERAALAKIEALPKPPGGAATISKWIAAQREVVTDMNNIRRADAASRGRFPSGALIRSQIDAERTLSSAKAFAHRIARGYGFKECGVES